MYNKILKHLFELADEKYKNFHAKLIPNIPTENIIGVRTPDLRKYAKELIRSGESESFITSVKHHYYDEKNLHAFIIEDIRDYDKLIYELERFLPEIDNWATCDMLSPKIFSKCKNTLLIKIKEWLSSDLTYTVRFGADMLMRHYLDNDFKPEYLKLIANIKSDEYYIKMVQAWFFATALAKQYESTIVYIEKKLLLAEVHNMTIKKARESYRISKEHKEYLKSLKL